MFYLNGPLFRPTIKMLPFCIISAENKMMRLLGDFQEFSKNENYNLLQLNKMNILFYHIVGCIAHYNLFMFIMSSCVFAWETRCWWQSAGWLWVLLGEQTQTEAAVHRTDPSHGKTHLNSPPDNSREQILKLSFLILTSICLGIKNCIYCKNKIKWDLDSGKPFPSLYLDCI